MFPNYTVVNISQSIHKITLYTLNYLHNVMSILLNKAGEKSLITDIQSETSVIL